MTKVKKVNAGKNAKSVRGGALKNKPYKLNLALQGGGAHGAFTWGVLDRLLEEEDIEIHGISGTSAGAMNGAMLVSGWAKGGAQGAKDTLRSFWQDVAAASAFVAPFTNMPNMGGFPNMGGGPNMGSFAVGDKAFNLGGNPFYAAFDMMSRVFSPYQTNPMNFNPLKTILERHLDVEALHTCCEKRLFVTATSVHTGHARVFRETEVDVNVLLASACIPFLFQAVEIDGEPFWDGGYMGNPAIWPLFYNTEVMDVLLVQINPLLRSDTPSTASDIINRLNEITFNSSLIAEMRAINFVSRLVKEHKLDETRYRDVRMHMVTGGDEFFKLDASSKMNARRDFFDALFEGGRAQAKAWIEQHKKDIGHKGSLDINDVFLDKKNPHYVTTKQPDKARKQKR